MFLSFLSMYSFVVSKMHHGFGLFKWNVNSHHPQNSTGSPMLAIKREPADPDILICHLSPMLICIRICHLSWVVYSNYTRPMVWLLSMLLLQMWADIFSIEKDFSVGHKNDIEDIYVFEVSEFLHIKVQHIFFI